MRRALGRGPGPGQPLDPARLCRTGRTPGPSDRPGRTGGVVRSRSFRRIGDGSAGPGRTPAAGGLAHRRRGPLAAGPHCPGLRPRRLQLRPLQAGEGPAGPAAGRRRGRAGGPAHRRGLCAGPDPDQHPRRRHGTRRAGSRCPGRGGGPRRDPVGGHGRRPAPRELSLRPCRGPGCRPRPGPAHDRDPVGRPEGPGGGPGGQGGDLRYRRPRPQALRRHAVDEEGHGGCGPCPGAGPADHGGRSAGAAGDPGGGSGERRLRRCHAPGGRAEHPQGADRGGRQYRCGGAADPVRRPDPGRGTLSRPDPGLRHPDRRGPGGPGPGRASLLHR